VGKPVEREHLEDPGADGRITLKNRYSGSGMGGRHGLD